MKLQPKMPALYRNLLLEDSSFSVLCKFAGALRLFACAVALVCVGALLAGIGTGAVSRRLAHACTIFSQLPRTEQTQRHPLTHPQQPEPSNFGSSKGLNAPRLHFLEPGAVQGNAAFPYTAKNKKWRELARKWANPDLFNAPLVGYNIYMDDGLGGEYR